MVSLGTQRRVRSDFEREKNNIAFIATNYGNSNLYCINYITDWLIETLCQAV